MLKILTMPNATGRSCLILGLAGHNVTRLQNNQPILVRGDQLSTNPKYQLSVDIVVMAGETDDAMITTLIEKGVIPSDFEQFKGDIAPGEERRWEPTPSAPIAFTPAERELITHAMTGKVVKSLSWESNGNYWVMTFTDESEITFRFMAEI